MNYYIDNELNIRASETGWPEVPPIMRSSNADALAVQKYEKELKKAKEESSIIDEQAEFVKAFFNIVQSFPMSIETARVHLKEFYGAGDLFIDSGIEVEFYDKRVFRNGYGNNSPRVGYVARPMHVRACRLKQLTDQIPPTVEGPTNEDIIRSCAIAHISGINVNAANFEHIAKTGTINGSLYAQLLDIISSTIRKIAELEKQLNEKGPAVEPAPQWERISNCACSSYRLGEGSELLHLIKVSGEGLYYAIKEDWDLHQSVEAQSLTAHQIKILYNIDLD